MCCLSKICLRNEINNTKEKENCQNIIFNSIKGLRIHTHRRQQQKIWERRKDLNKRLLYVFIFGNISWTCSPCFELISYLCYSRHVSNTGLGFSLFFALFLMLLRQFTVNCLETRVFDKESFPSFSLKRRDQKTHKSITT